MGQSKNTYAPVNGRGRCPFSKLRWLRTWPDDRSRSTTTFANIQYESQQLPESVREIKNLAAPTSFTHCVECLFAAVVLTVACGGPAHSGASLPADLLGRAEREETVRVIVELQAGPEKIQATQDLALEAIAGTLYRLTRRYQSVPFLALEVSAEALRRLMQSPVVCRIQEDRAVRPHEKMP